MLQLRLKSLMHSPGRAALSQARAVQDVLVRTTLDALIAAGDLGLGTRAQDWGHSQFLEDLEYCAVASAQCVVMQEARHAAVPCHVAGA